ncbi:hypothetical protein BHE18_13065 [Rossellomorea aquimaris]|uniref:Uncharacterized protein n=1 Tax=Rossellomorea aquimaris TaxID=189382 RepID=A0A1J6VP74_9BACI|nr:hypothetical protein BHE18_13065 [Rossellomorea aquimaris]
MFVFWGVGGAVEAGNNLLFRFCWVKVRFSIKNHTLAEVRLCRKIASSHLKLEFRTYIKNSALKSRDFALIRKIPHLNQEIPHINVFQSQR